MKKVSVVFSILLVLSLIIASDVFAARSTIYLPKEQVWTNKHTFRTMKYSYVEARLMAVYPTDASKDNYRYIQTRVTSDDGRRLMSDTITLDERVTSNIKIPLREGTLDIQDIRFQFRGNHPGLDAYADVIYNGL